MIHQARGESAKIANAGKNLSCYGSDREKLSTERGSSQETVKETPINASLFGNIMPQKPTIQHLGHMQKDFMYSHRGQSDR
jgi:hypothetical protein